MSLLQDIYEDVSQTQPIFDAGTVDIDKFKESIKAPYRHAYLSTLGGEDTATIMLKVSLDPQHTWQYGYFENSHYMAFRIERDGVVEQFHSSHKLHKKFRKARVKSLDDAAKKINAYVVDQNIPF